MKKILFVFSSCAILAACGGSGNGAEGEEYYNRDSEGDEVVYSDSASEAEMSASTRQSEVDTNLNNIGTDRTATAAPATQGTGAAQTSGAAKTSATAQADNYEKGKNLIAMSDCLSCHQVDKRLVGPGYVEVAEKYEMNDKNVDYLAGKIIQGGAGVWGQIPMTPHPDLKKEDAAEMAKYILSLKK
jgi:cytochrome c